MWQYLVRIVLWNQNFWFSGMCMLKCFYCHIDLQKTVLINILQHWLFLKLCIFFPLWWNGVSLLLLIFVFYIPDNWGVLKFLFYRYMLCDGEAFWKFLFFISDSGLQGCYSSSGFHIISILGIFLSPLYKYLWL